MRTTTDPLILARLLGVQSIDYAARLDVSPQWARLLAKDPRHTRRVLVAVLEAAVEQLRLEETVTGDARR